MNLIKISTEKLYQNLYIKINWLAFTLISIILVILTKKSLSIVTDIFLLAFITIIYGFYIKKVYKYFVVFASFCIYFYLFYKFNWDIFSESDIFYVSELKKNYAILTRGFNQYLLTKIPEKIRVGEFVKAIGELEKLNDNGNFWDFNFNKWLIDKNIIYELRNFDIKEVLFKDIRFYFYNLESSSNRLALIMIFHNKQESNLYNNLNQLSIGYMLNISGLYLIPIGYFSQRYIFKNKSWYKKWKFILYIFLFMYLYMCNFSPIIFKVFLLMVINWVEQNFRIKINKISKISLVWLIILFWNPMYIFNMGFIYTSAAILLIKHHNDKKKSTMIILNIILINAIFIPIDAYFNYKVYWITELQQLILLPLLFIGFILVSFFYIPFLNPIANFVHDSLEKLSTFFVKYNVTTLIGNVSIVWLILYFICLFLLTKFVILNKKIKRLIYFLLATSITISFITNPIKNSISTIEMINVGNGNSFILNYKSNIFLLDAGVGPMNNKNTTPNYLKYRGINEINTIFISHYHTDHYNMVDQIVKENNVKHVFDNKSNIKEINFKDIFIYAFTENFNDDENDNSQVILIKMYDQTFLFMGDSSKKREERLLQETKFIKLIDKGIDYYQVGHHGSKTATSDKFIKTIKPKNCFISGEKRGRRQFPTHEALSVLEKYNCNIYTTGGLNSYKYYINSKEVEVIKKELF
ncbi:competence protein ComEC [Spiroplasma helicoides]|uniref:Competence protein ComEC n=1 Tax=Spiroplasma helicoides TaxID=216938 RepID=A0A1B3SKN4_9MOLU|nr:ComEC/Rec2 family competence protein [Spiroplasma helicoides]AOG60502.1 competence protein ComEC [Spiroplasma helicoides]